MMLIKLILGVAAALQLSLADAAKLGDKGKGWEVKQYKNSDIIFCEYNGKFRIAPGVGSCQNAVMAFSDPDQGCTKNHDVSLEIANAISSKPKSTVFTIKPLRRGSDGAPKGYQIIAENGCLAKYLALPKDVKKVKLFDSVPVELDNSKKWVYSLNSHGTDSDGSIECLNDVDILSQNYYTSLWVSSGKKGCVFTYDGDESDWKLIPV